MWLSKRLTESFVYTNENNLKFVYNFWTLIVCVNQKEIIQTDENVGINDKGFILLNGFSPCSTNTLFKVEVLKVVAHVLRCQPVGRCPGVGKVMSHGICHFHSMNPHIPRYPGCVNTWKVVCNSLEGGMQNHYNLWIAEGYVLKAGNDWAITWENYQSLSFWGWVKPWNDGLCFSSEYGIDRVITAGEPPLQHYVSDTQAWMRSCLKWVSANHNI